MHRYRKQFDGCQVGEVGVMGEKGEGIQMYQMPVTKSHGDIKYILGNIVNNILTTTCGVRCVLELPGRSLCEIHKCLITVLYT